MDGNAPVVKHLGGRELKGHFVGVNAGKVDIELVGFLVDKAVSGVDVAVVKAAAGQRWRVRVCFNAPTEGRYCIKKALCKRIMLSLSCIKFVSLCFAFLTLSAC